MITVQRHMNNGVYHGIIYNTKTKKRLTIHQEKRLMYGISV